MDYKDLINRLKNETYWLGSGEPYSRDIHPVICDEAAIAIIQLLERVEKAEYQKDKAIRTINNILGCQKFCVLCGNIECKNSNTRDASCNPMWNGLEE